MVFLNTSLAAILNARTRFPLPRSPVRRRARQQTQIAAPPLFLFCTFLGNHIPLTPHEGQKLWVM